MAPRLGPREWLLVSRTAAWRPVLPLMKHALPLERLVGLMSSPRDVPRDPAREALAARAASRFWRSHERPCLERSLVLYRQLGRLGARPELIVGVARDEHAFSGHAWVVVDGAAVLERGDPERSHSVLVAFDTFGNRRVPPAESQADPHPALGAPQRSPER